MTNNIKIAIAVLVLAVAGYFIYSSMGSENDSEKGGEDKLMRTNQTDNPVELGSKEVEFELLDEMSHYGQ